MIQYFQLSIRSLTHQKFRTFLTLLGVIIGITAVVSMVSIAGGMQQSVKKMVEEFGADKIIVTSQQQFGIGGKGLTDSDANAIEKIIGVKQAMPMYATTAGSEFNGEQKALSVWGMDPEKAERTFSDAQGVEILRGRWIQKGDRSKITIGYALHDDYYQRKVNIGNSIEIQGVPFRVVGIFKETGDKSHDTVVYADIDQVRKVLGREDQVTTIIVRVKEGHDVTQTRDRIELLLEKRHEDSEFTIMTSQQMLENIESVLKIVQVVFGGIAGVSLLVGGIGIANTMLMNVLEQTREIGIMKATGAESGNIVKIFLVESGIIGIVGGSLGVVFGYIISKVMNVAAELALGSGNLTTHVSTNMVIFSLTFSFVVGVLSGIYPAYRAAQLDPVEALGA